MENNKVSSGNSRQQWQTGSLNRPVATTRPSYRVAQNSNRQGNRGQDANLETGMSNPEM